MRILLNGTEREVPAGCSLASLVPQRPGLAAAVNGDIVRGWDQVLLHDGDAVELLTALQGG